MTDEEKAEEYIKNEVCIKLCPTWKANGEKCDLFPQCHYISSKIKYYRLGLAEGRKEGYEKGLDTFPNTRRENRDLIDKLNMQNQRLNELKAKNEELQCQIRVLTETRSILQEQVEDNAAQIEKMKRCNNCEFECYEKYHGEKCNFGNYKTCGNWKLTDAE